jgi:hypothetical protein
MHVSPEKVNELVTARFVTERLLQDVASLGFSWKSIDHYRFDDTPGNSCWFGIDESRGWIRLMREWTPGCVAHELGHGFHERLRTDKHLPDEFGEDYAEAIRWFAEERIGWTVWRDDFARRGRRDDRVLNACGWAWCGFLENLRSGRFYPTA